MWSIHGALCFAAEDAGAASVTGVDVMGPTERFSAERARRGSSMRFVQGDMHEPATIAEVGRARRRLVLGRPLPRAASAAHARAPARADDGTLLLATETIAETPGRRDTCVIAPVARRAPQRRARRRPGAGYGPWYWGISPSALRTMLKLTGFAVAEEHRTPFHVTVVATPR